MNRPGTLKTTDTEKPPEEDHQYLIFNLGKEAFAIGILQVKEIIEYGQLTEVPMMPDVVRGVINLRGSVVPVIDLAISLLETAHRGGSPQLHHHCGNDRNRTPPGDGLRR